MKSIAVILSIFVAVALISGAGYGNEGTMDSSPQAITVESDWFDSFYPYRVEIDLDGVHQGKLAIDVSTEELINALRKVSVDTLNLKSFAFEKAVLVDPATKMIVGGFKLITESENLIKHGDFDSSIAMADSPWKGFVPTEMRVEKVETDGESFNALYIKKEVLEKGKLAQPVILDPGSFYLLGYRFFNNPVRYNLTVKLADARFSHVKLLNSLEKWINIQQLLYANGENSELSLNTRFTGECAAGDISLRKVSWKLIGDISNKTSMLHLYYVPRAGRELTVPTNEMIMGVDEQLKIANLKGLKASRWNPNEDGVLVRGRAADVWTIPGAYPLKAGILERTMPSESTSASRAKINLFKGEAESLIIAIKTGTPRIKINIQNMNLPVDVRHEYIARIPVYDGPHPRGKFIETRFDALTELNDPLTPANKEGIHLIAITFTANKETPAGVFNDTVRMTVQTQAPDTETFEIPVAVNVLALIGKPLWHFRTSFSGAHVGAIYPSYSNIGVKTVAEFHGFNIPEMFIRLVFDTTYYNKVEPKVFPVRKLAWKYYNRMIDYHLVPETLGLWAGYTYKIKIRGEGKAPELYDWDFSDFDKAIDEFLVKRDVPYFTIFRTTGHIMDRFKMANDVVYSFAEKGKTGNPLWEDLQWKTIPEEEFYKLVADYFDAVAGHFVKRGYSDRMLYVIDECNAETFETVYKYWQAFQKKKYAKFIKIGHTAFVTSIWTAKLPDGELIMDKVLNVPMPLNDDRWNFLEPEINALQKNPDLDQWVYYIATDHFNLNNAGLSTVITPLKLRNFGARGWLCWASFIWSIPWEDRPVINPWLNPWSPWGAGLVSFFYPPDPRGPVQQPTYKIVPSYRLALMRDGIEDFTLLEILNSGKDDAGKKLKVNRQKLEQAEKILKRMWADNPVQWYISYGSYRRAKQLLYEALDQ